MNRFIVGLLLLGCCAPALGQKTFFMYLQTESERPFFIRVNDRTQSSTNSGFLILSNLRDTVYRLKLGFPDGGSPEQQFVVDLKGRDHGYLVKSFGEKGWGLYDLQSVGVTMAETNGSVRMERKDVSAFTAVLSKAANDPSLLEQAVLIAKQETKAISPALVRETVNAAPDKLTDSSKTISKTDLIGDKKMPVTTSVDSVRSRVRKDEAGVVVKNEAALKERKDTVVAKRPDAITQKVGGDQPANEGVRTVVTRGNDSARAKDERVVVQTTAKDDVAYKRSKVTKRSESSTGSGFGLTFTDDYGNGRIDTIRIIIPPAKLTRQVADTVRKETVKTPVKQPRRDSVQAGAGNGVKEVAKTAPVSRRDTLAARVDDKGSKLANHCVAMASEDDFVKLRKRMVAEKKDDNRTEEGKKAFKSKCYTTAQIRDMGSLYGNEVGKYLFYEAAYAAVSDREAFASLQSEFKDNYLVYRFKKLIGD